MAVSRNLILEYQQGKQVECKRKGGVASPDCEGASSPFQIHIDINIGIGQPTFVSASELDGKEAVAKMATSRAAERRI